MHGNGPYPFESNEAYAKAEAAGRVNSGIASAKAADCTVSECARSPWDVADALHQLSDKYAGPSAEHRLMREAVEVINRQQHQVAMESARADCAERAFAALNGKVKLATLALNSVTVD